MNINATLVGEIMLVFVLFVGALLLKSNLLWIIYAACNW
jgi:hypothetical protein